MNWSSQIFYYKILPELCEKNAKVPSAKPAMTLPWEYLADEEATNSLMIYVDFSEHISNLRSNS